MTFELANGQKSIKNICILLLFTKWYYIVSQKLSFKRPIIKNIDYGFFDIKSLIRQIEA